MLQTFGAIAEKHGPWAVFCIGLLLLLYFVGQRFTKALDTLAQSGSSVAKAVTTSSEAQIRAFGALTERVSRLEGKVDALGGLAVRAAADAPSEELQSVAEVFDGEESTPIQPVPVPRTPTKRKQTEPKGVPYSINLRPQKGGGK